MRTGGNKRYSGFDVVLGGLLTALALGLPVVFHAVGLGSAFLPMFYPVLAAGFLVAFPAAVWVGVLAPLLSGLLMGMPPFYPPIAFLMALEGVVFTGVAALCYRRWKWNPWGVAVLAVLADRLTVWGAAEAAARWLDFPPGVFSAAMVLRGAPGAVGLCLAVPPLVKLAEKRLAVLWAGFRPDEELES